MSEAAFVSSAAASLLKELAHSCLAQPWRNTILEFRGRHVPFN
jgi:hypothetical protein